MQFHKIHAQLLLRHHLFSPMDEHDLERLIRTAHIVSISRGEFLFQQGDDASCFYFVISGCIKLFRNLPDGTEKIFGLAADGQSFAEALMFKSQNTYPVSAQAAESTELICFPCEEYMEMVRSNSKLSLALLGDLSVRLKDRLEEIEVLSLKNSTHRVIRYFMARMILLSDNQSEFLLPVAKRLIAAQLSIQPETLSRIIHKLVDEGIIEINGKRIKILDRQRLENYE